MLLTFKSTTGADLIMFDKNAAEILTLIGKNPEDKRGIILVEQLPAALATLRNALATSPRPDSGTEEDGAEETVGLAQRAIPFLEMLERALTNNEAVTWGI